MTGLKTVLVAMIAAASLGACGTLAGAAVGDCFEHVEQSVRGLLLRLARQ